MRVEGLFRYYGSDGTPLAAFHWPAQGKVRGIVQLSHGAGEHSARYRSRLSSLNEAGWSIYAADHRGHGLTSGLTGLGKFGPGGARACVDDLATLSAIARDRHPDVPLILLGHSLGAAFVQCLLANRSNLLDGVLLSGTCALGLPRLPNWNASIENPRTPYDWLSRDAQQVDEYISDPLCGIQFCPDSRDSLNKLLTDDPRRFASVRADLPVHIITGSDDPVIEGGARLDPLLTQLRTADLSPTVKVYEGARHELLNETNRDAVMTDILNWLETVLAAQVRASTI